MKIIVTKEQLNEHIKRKKAERIFEKIVTDIHKNTVHLKENISKDQANQSTINGYKKKNLISPLVLEMLISYNIVNEKSEII
jgi:hypothetical protein